MTRTTLDIEPDILDQLKRRRRRGKTLGSLVSELLAKALAETPNASTEPLIWNARDLGPRVDLGDKEALRRALEDP
ncbi:MAG: antitoxin [Candidatus Dormiibacterota bacterium]